MDVTRGMFRVQNSAGSHRWDLFLGIPASQSTTSIERRIVQNRVLRGLPRLTNRKKTRIHVVVRAACSFPPAFSLFVPSFSPLGISVFVDVSHSGNSPEASPVKDTRVGNRRTYTRNHFGLLKTHRFAIYVP